ncbi:MAG: flippase-like domain-containing protein, partial [Desulfofustis sp.]|nr:flippase-like domain-containing protein [Desulfofustis sp.]
MRRIALVALKLAVSLGLLFLLYRQTPIDQIKALLASIEFAYLPAIGLLLLFNTLISAWKWQLFLRADGVSIGLGDLIMSYMSGTFCNLFLPSNIGGDSYRIYDIARRSRDGARSAASVFADRFSGFIALVILSLLSSFFVSLQFRSLSFMLVPLALLAAFLGVLVVIARQT